MNSVVRNVIVLGVGVVVFLVAICVVGVCSCISRWL